MIKNNSVQKNKNPNYYFYPLEYQKNHNPKYLPLNILMTLLKDHLKGVNLHTLKIKAG